MNPHPGFLITTKRDGRRWIRFDSLPIDVIVGDTFFASAIGDEACALAAVDDAAVFVIGCRDDVIPVVGPVKANYNADDFSQTANARTIFLSVLEQVHS